MRRPQAAVVVSALILTSSLSSCAATKRYAAAYFTTRRAMVHAAFADDSEAERSEVRQASYCEEDDQSLGSAAAEAILGPPLKWMFAEALAVAVTPAVYGGAEVHDAIVDRRERKNDQQYEHLRALGEQSRIDRAKLAGPGGESAAIRQVSDAVAAE